MTGLEQMVQSLEGLQGINLVQTTGGGPYDGHTYIPHQMRPLIDCSPMREHADYYWWRAVSATFIARPNRETLAVLAQYTNLPVQDFSDTVTMFVRHGDKVPIHSVHIYSHYRVTYFLPCSSSSKGIEMKLLDFAEYARVAQLLWDRGMVPQSARYLQAKLTALQSTAATANITSTRLRRRRMQSVASHNHTRNSSARRLPATNGSFDGSSGPNLYRIPVPTGVRAPEGVPLPTVPYNGTIFLTTEDPAVIKQANEWGALNHWSVVYTNLFDRSDSIKLNVHLRSFETEYIRPSLPGDRNQP